MNSEYEKIEGNLILDENLTLFGMVAGSVTVVENGEIVLHGMVVGDLTVGVGGRATINGTVVRNVVSQGGVISFLGTAQGDFVLGNGENTIDPKAVISGRTI